MWAPSLGDFPPARSPEITATPDMAQTQSIEKLHAACDECRTRKLKCSGGKPKCGRCQREEIVCIYSAQKTMGRPRKRRRGSEADAPSEQPPNTHNGHDDPLNGFTIQPSFSSFGLVSPPEFADIPSGNEVYAQAQLDPSLVGIYGPQPAMNDLE
ncbi:hypothetical protein OPT61_g9669 [Boeremia exigua]|uniref:Uncharacterized protein n=1 Tax=Boeremia exigua TaxID=749465 RepID=A0ACC2HTE9_9PLEO|nr:hypothetical protein OPT61_g9669 [Boeremia exigua]